MERFRTKQPVDYENPYVDMLSDIARSIKRFDQIKHMPPNYILINTADYEHLQEAYHTAGVLPRNAELTIIENARVIRTPDMETGTYDTVGF